MASVTHRTIQNAMKKACLEVPDVASQRRLNKQKIPQNRGLARTLVPVGANHCQTRDHSHPVINELEKSLCDNKLKTHLQSMP